MFITFIHSTFTATWFCNMIFRRHKKNRNNSNKQFRNIQLKYTIVSDKINEPNRLPVDFVLRRLKEKWVLVSWLLCCCCFDFDCWLSFSALTRSASASILPSAIWCCVQQLHRAAGGRPTPSSFFVRCWRCWQQPTSQRFSEDSWFGNSSAATTAPYRFFNIKPIDIFG